MAGFSYAIQKYDNVVRVFHRLYNFHDSLSIYTVVFELLFFATDCHKLSPLKISILFSWQKNNEEITVP